VGRGPVRQLRRLQGLNGVTLELETGELRCLIGPNGAGKTTLMDVITGKTRPDTGGVFLDRRENDLTKLSSAASPSWASAQVPAPDGVPGAHGVRELRARAARAQGRAGARCSRRRTPRAGAHRRGPEIIGLAEHATRQAGLLSHGQKQWLEIGMLLAQDPKVLLVDEPGGRHDPRRDGAAPRSCCAAWRASTPSSSSSTTWSSCAASRGA
jgi:urea transport system ATP-binding protein